MKNKLLSIFLVLIAFFISYSPAYALTPFFSNQLGTSPTNGQILQTDGTNSHWVATSTLGFSGGVSSVFGRTGAVVATAGDYTTALVTEVTNLYFTNARAIASTLTGFSATTGTVSSTDSIIIAIEKLAGNAASYLTNITGLITPGTNVTISGSGTSGSPYVINATSGGSSFGYPFTNPSEYGTTTAATTTPIWAQEGLFASSTSHFANSDFVNSTTTTLGIGGSGSQYGAYYLPGPDYLNWQNYSATSPASEVRLLKNYTGANGGEATIDSAVDCSGQGLFNNINFMDGPSIDDYPTSYNAIIAVGAAGTCPGIPFEFQNRGAGANVNASNFMVAFPNGTVGMTGAATSTVTLSTRLEIASSTAAEILEVEGTPGTASTLGTSYLTVTGSNNAVGAGRIGFGTSSPVDAIAASVGNNQGLTVDSTGSAFIGFGKGGATRFRLQGNFTQNGQAELLYNNGTGSAPNNTVMTWVGNPAPTGSVAGNVGIGTTTPGSLFAVQGIANFTLATSTFSATGGINLLSGCYAVRGTCIGSSGGTGTNYFSISGSNTFLNTGTNLQAPTLNATSTTATSTFSGDVSIGSTGELPNPYLNIGTSSVPIYGRVQGDVIDSQYSWNGQTSINVANGNIGSCASATFFADGNNPTLGGYYGTFSFLNDGWTGVGCGIGAGTAQKPEAVVLANPTGEMDFVIASTTNNGAADFNWFSNTNTPLMKLTNAGNLGVGTTSPSKLFTVEGNQSGGIARVQRDAPGVTANQSFGTYDVELNELGVVMQQGSGPGQTFSVATSGGPPVILSQVDAYRDGADNQGALQFITSNGASSNFVTLNHLGFLSLGAANSSLNPVSTITDAGNLSVGAAYDAIQAPTDGAIIVGSVGIGTSSPSDILTVATGNNQGIRVSSSNAAFLEVGEGNASRFRIENNFTQSGQLEFVYNNGSGAAPGATAMTIVGNPAAAGSTAGNVGIGTTTPGAVFSVQGNVLLHGVKTGAGGGAACLSAGGILSFDSGANCITSTPLAKYDIHPISDSQANEVLQLSPVQYNYYSDGSSHYGFIADAATQKIDPSLVVLAQVDTDVTGAEGETVVVKAGQPLSFDYERYTGLLTAFVQNLSKRQDAQQEEIDVLQTEVATLERGENMCVLKSI